MCRSVAEGGQRCAAHTRPRFEAATPGTAEWDEAAAAYASTPSGRKALLVEWGSPESRFEGEAVAHALQRGEALREQTVAVRAALKDAASRQEGAVSAAWVPPKGTGGKPISTPQGAFDRCKRTSAVYTAHLRDQGVQADWVQVDGYRGDGSKAVKQWHTMTQEMWGHYLTRITHDDGRVEYVDWTARQFDPEADYPLVTTDLSSWHEVYNIDVAGDPDGEKYQVLGGYLRVSR